MFSHRILKVVALFYQGNSVECPVCENTFSKFLPYGRLQPRKNALCPKCLSLERHRLLWLYLKDRTDFFKSEKKVLHIAPELSFMDRFRKMTNLDYTTGDLESPLADVKMDIHSIPFEDNTFDVSFCNHVMEHVEDDLKAMREIYRILKPGGWAIIQVPFFHPLSETTFDDPEITDKKGREIAFGQDDHVRKYGLDYAERLKSVGFDVTEDEFVGSISTDEQQRYALPPNEIIYMCRKYG